MGPEARRAGGGGQFTLFHLFALVFAVWAAVNAAGVSWDRFCAVAGIAVFLPVLVAGYVVGHYLAVPIALGLLGLAIVYDNWVVPHMPRRQSGRCRPRHYELESCDPADFRAHGGHVYRCRCGGRYLLKNGRTACVSAVESDGVTHPYMVRRWGRSWRPAHALDRDLFV